MRELGQYVVSVSAGAILCGMVLSLGKDSGHGEIIRLLCGVFLAITALAPLKEVSIPEFSETALIYEFQGEELTALGQTLAEDAMASIIKTEMQAYILDKAAELNLALDAEIIMEKGIPTGVWLHGMAAPWQIQQMEKLITQELGISKENLQWTGRK